MKRKKLMVALLAGTIIIGVTTAAFAESAIQLFYNGQEIKGDTAPVNINGKIYASVRAIAEAMGADVSWDKDSNQINIIGKDQGRQIEALERALAPKDSLGAVNSWAEAVKQRNGAWQYALMTPELKSAFLDELASMGWTTGTSSPWVKEFKVKKIAETDQSVRYSVTFTWTDSIGSLSDSVFYVTIIELNDVWLLSLIEDLDVKGEITELNKEDQFLRSFFVEGKADSGSTYELAKVFLSPNTKIYQGYTKNELKSDSLKDGTHVEVDFKDGPMLMIYPPQAEAEIIRVFDGC
ncbi:MAG: copper amine oxidase family protein [Bacillota bacterium]|jgi:hypothetical protein|nr:copper amine oxidase family protein [Bacillota bacterium]